MNFLKIGLRSIGRNRRRTFVTTFAIGFAGAIMIFYSSLMEGFLTTMERNALSMELGEVQVHANGYRRDPDLYKSIADPQKLITDLRSKGYKASYRLYGYGLAAAGVSSAGVQLRGLNLDSERTVTRVHEHILEGAWLSPEHPKGVVIGRKLARSLRVKVGGELVLVGQAADGSMANDLYRVRGILKPISDAVDRGGLMMVEAAFRELMTLPKGAHEVVVVRPTRDFPLEQAVSQITEVAPGLETKSWRTLRPMLARTFDTSMASQFFMMLITYAAIAMVVLNATLMSVFERIREFGVMKALGMGPKQIFGVVMIEVSAQTVLAGLVAMGLGLPLSLYFQRYGIDLSEMSGGVSMMGVAFDPVWYCEVNANVVLLPLFVLALIVAATAMYPGIKAAMIQPVEAIRHR